VITDRLIGYGAREVGKIMKGVAALPFAVALAIAVSACGVGHHTPRPAASVAAGPQASSAVRRTGTAQAATVYVAHNSRGTVTPISTITNLPGKPVRVAKGTAAIAITPDGKTVYVAGWRAGTVTPITTATNMPGKPIKVGNTPDWITITPDGQTAYVANWGSGTVTPITTATNTPGKPIQAGKAPFALVIAS
jgi:YVTN family beta-propeller protein